MTSKRLFALLGAALVFATGTAFAQAGGKAAAGQEEKIRALFQEKVGQPATSVSRSPVSGLWEVVVGTQIYYVDPEVNYVLNGQLFETRTRTNLTQVKRDELLKIDWKTLPLNQAVKLVRGNGSRVIATFEDPNCGYCKRLHSDLMQMNDTTVYVFMYPILSPDSMERAKGIWCSKDRAAAWVDQMVSNKAPATAPADCKHPLQENVALGQKFGVDGTPTIFFTDGTRGAGALPVAQIEQRIAAIGKK